MAEEFQVQKQPEMTRKVQMTKKIKNTSAVDFYDYFIMQRKNGVAKRKLASLSS